MYNEILSVGRNSVKVVEYDNLEELARERSGPNVPKSLNNEARWAGGSLATFKNGCAVGDTRYSDRADKLVSHFSNIAIENHSLALSWNDTSGELDYEAAMAGEAECLYGPTITENPASPVSIYVDQWTSCTIPTSYMERRGIAILALVQALSVFRPVNAFISTATRHVPTNTDLIQIIRVPTNPMDLARASWMIAAPVVFRQCFIPMTFVHAKSNMPCGIPLLSDASWQRNKMASWLAEREGVKDVVFLPYMMGKEHNWSNDKAVLDWVNSQLQRFIE